MVTTVYPNSEFVIFIFMGDKFSIDDFLFSSFSEITSDEELFITGIKGKIQLKVSVP